MKGDKLNMEAKKNPYNAPKSGVVLKEGDVGEQVMWLQFELKRTEPDLKITGKFDYNTKVNVMKYQAGIGLVPDGVAWTGIIESLANRAEEK